MTHMRSQPVTVNDVGRRVDTRGRMRSEPLWPQGGMVTKRLCDYNYDVQQFTGRSVSNITAGQWERGRIIRQNQIELHPSGRELFMYDPTRPAEWHHNFH